MPTMDICGARTVQYLQFDNEELTYSTQVRIWAYNHWEIYPFVKENLAQHSANKHNMMLTQMHSAVLTMLTRPPTDSIACRNIEYRNDESWAHEPPSTLNGIVPLQPSFFLKPQVIDPTEHLPNTSSRQA